MWEANVLASQKHRIVELRISGLAEHYIKIGKLDKDTLWDALEVSVTLLLNPIPQILGCRHSGAVSTL